MVNRSAVVVTAKQPLVEWLRLVDPKPPAITLDEAREDSNIYLLPESDDSDASELLERSWESIFENELAEWYTREDLWPARRTLKMFREWFDCEFHSTIIDLVDAPLLDDQL